MRFLRILRTFFILKGEEIVENTIYVWTPMLIIFGISLFSILIASNEIVFLYFMWIFVLIIFTIVLSVIIIALKRWFYSNWVLATEIETDK